MTAVCGAVWNHAGNSGRSYRHPDGHYSLNRTFWGKPSQRHTGLALAVRPGRLSQHSANSEPCTESLAFPRMRALVCAMLLFGANIANLALAPQFIGILSDVLSAGSGDTAQSLRIALLLNAFTGFWAVYHFLVRIPAIVTGCSGRT